MILIADSGSTKTDWRLIQAEEKIRPVQTAGINPFFQDKNTIKIILQDSLIPAIAIDAKEVKQIYFYGAGCSTADKKQEVAGALSELFIHAGVHIETDMLGAARALCGKEAGIACILGTGSNSCYYDGTTITENTPSFGYLFGDYGSGAHIGKTLIQQYFDKQLPADLQKNFEARKENTRELMLENVYKKPFPNRYLAGFSKFVFQNKEHPYCIDLLKKCFHLFFEKQVEQYPAHKKVPIHAVGSVAYYYNSIVKAVAEERGLNMGTIIETPIAALTLYHLEN